MTTISYCSYSPDKRPLTPLDHDKVGLLNKGADHDITNRVKDVVQRLLDYKGTEKFSVEFTRQKITFSLKTAGSDVQNRTLTNVSGQWMLSKNSAPATALAPELQKEVDHIIDEVLYRIRNSHNSGAPDARSPSFDHSPSSFDTYSPRYEPAPQFYPLEPRSFGPRDPSYETSSRARSLSYSTESYRRRSPEASSERDGMERRIGELQKTLDETDGKHRQRLEKLHRNYEEAQKLGLKRYEELKGQLLEAQEANTAKDAAALASKRRIDELEASVAEKETQLRESREAFEADKHQAKERQKGIESELAEVKASLEKLHRVAQEQKAQLESQLGDVQAELASVKDTNKTLARAGSGIVALQSQKKALEERLVAASCTESRLVADIEVKTAKLVEAARIAEENMKQMEELQTSLQSAEAQLEQMKKTESALQEQLVAEQEKAKKMEAGLNGKLTLQETAYEKLRQASRQVRSKAIATTEENTALKVEAARLATAAKSQAEELERLSALLLETNRALDAEKAKTKLMQDMLHSHELQSEVATREKSKMDKKQSKEMLSSLAAEYRAPSRFQIPGEVAEFKTFDARKEDH